MKNDLDKKLLIIEDDKILRSRLVTEFSDGGFTVVTAQDGEEGLAKALAERPDIILLDIIMPKMDGMTMMRKLRTANEWGKAVTIVILTNLNTDDRIMKGIVEDEPAYYLVKKDWQLSDVMEKVKACLKDPL